LPDTPRGHSKELAYCITAYLGVDQMSSHRILCGDLQGKPWHFVNAQTPGTLLRFWLERIDMIGLVLKVTLPTLGPAHENTYVPMILIWKNALEYVRIP
jgi:hypothetical protein